MHIDIPGERGAVQTRTPTYDVNPLYHGGVRSSVSDVVRHLSMVSAIKDMVSLIKANALTSHRSIYGWYIQYNDGSIDPPYAEFILEEK